jgi:hypothetical protein
VPDRAKLESNLRRVLISKILRLEFLDAHSEIQLSLVDFLRGNWPGELVHAQAGCGSALISVGATESERSFYSSPYTADRESRISTGEEALDFKPTRRKPLGGCRKRVR